MKKLGIPILLTASLLYLVSIFGLTIEINLDYLNYENQSLLNYRLGKITEIQNESLDNFRNQIENINKSYLNQEYEQTLNSLQQQNQPQQVLTETKSAETAPTQTTYGNVGRLYIPKCGYTARLFAADIYKKDNSNLLQAYTDMEDYASVYATNDCVIIGDHYNQGFSCINNLVAGDVIYIEKADKTRINLKCVCGGDGINNGQIYFQGKNILYDRPAKYCLYTCHGNDSYNVTCRFFTEI